ncbi:MAG: MBL fold metallo-hydrolase, partial [bacterium]|nr:MBL fold metallo-hydrolase [bacterium]
MTSVTITGTGMPVPSPYRAGPGVLVQSHGVALQVDAGRATTMRLAALGVSPVDLDAVFVTHHHSDH